MTENKAMDWNGFLEIAMQQYPEEACGFLYSKRPYTKEEEWVVFPCRNVHESPETNWSPDLKQMQSIKKKAAQQGLVKLGNVHSHPFPKEKDITEESVQEEVLPSDLDLLMARKHRDIVRGIVVTNGKAILARRFHDPYNNEVQVTF